MKTRTNDTVPLRILGLYALVLVGLFLIFYTMAWYTRSHGKGGFKVPNEKAVAEKLLEDQLTGPRYFQLEPATPETPHPYLSPFQAKQQVSRIVQERHLEPAKADRLEKLIDELTEPSPSRAIGTDRVNILRLNLALDALP